ncbi:MAG: hypothetical protein JW904_11255 [Spirochaetales bacterium]|nr:hypothetical protein [Spirochaetales bacterium]
MRVWYTVIISIAVIFLSLFLVSCDPFNLSFFPSYLNDVEIMKNLSSGTSFVDDNEVQEYALGALYDGNAEYVFLVMRKYTGRQRLMIFRDDLSLYWDSDANLSVPDDTIERIGRRFFVSRDGFFVVGNLAIDILLAAPAIMQIVQPPGGGYYQNGYGAELNFGPAGAPDMQDVFFRDWDMTDLEYHYWDNFATAPSGGAVTMHFNYYNLRVSFARSFKAAGGGYAFTAIILHREDWDGNDFRSWAIRLNGDNEFDSIPFLVSNTPVYPVFALGDTWEDAHAVDEGIIFRSKYNGNLYLLGWDSIVIAQTNYEGRFTDVVYDYGSTGFYYIYDPKTQKIFKVKNWWQ